MSWMPSRGLSVLCLLSQDRYVLNFPHYSGIFRHNLMNGAMIQILKEEVLKFLT